MDYHEMLEVSESLGEKGQSPWSKLIGYTNGASAVEGGHLPQYCFTSGLKLAD